MVADWIFFGFKLLKLEAWSFNSLKLWSLKLWCLKLVPQFSRNFSLNYLTQTPRKLWAHCVWNKVFLGHCAQHCQRLNQSLKSHWLSLKETLPVELEKSGKFLEGALLQRAQSEGAHLRCNKNAFGMLHVSIMKAFLLTGLLGLYHWLLLEQLSCLHSRHTMSL